MAIIDKLRLLHGSYFPLQRRYKRSQNTHLLYVNSVFSIVYALLERKLFLVQRSQVRYFSTKNGISLLMVCICHMFDAGLRQKALSTIV